MSIRLRWAVFAIICTSNKQDVQFFTINECKMVPTCDFNKCLLKTEGNFKVPIHVEYKNTIQNQNSLLVIRKTDNYSPGAVTGGWN